MNTRKKIRNLIPSNHGIASIVAVAGLAMGGQAIAQDYDWNDEEYEWEAGEGLHEEEWYDPSDWFNDDDRIDYENDDWGYGDYDYEYYADDWYDQEPEYEVYYMETWVEPRNQWNTDNQRHQADRNREAELRGQLDGWNKVSIEGERDAHTLVRLRLENGRSAIVNLGPNVEASRLNLQTGDRVAVHGKQGSIDGRQVLMAKKIRAGDRTITMDNWVQDDRMTNRNQQQDRWQSGQTQADRSYGDQQDRSQQNQWRQDRDRQTDWSQRDREQQDRWQRERDTRDRTQDRWTSGDQSTRTADRDQRQSRDKMHPDAQMVQQVMDQWPSESRKAAQQMLSKYGKPHGVTPDMMVWKNTGPFVKSIVHANPVQHNFPAPHKDVLEQFVNLDVPKDKMDEIAKFDGSIIVFQTDGLVSARCHKEAMNLAALNLAAKIAADDTSVDDAREKMAKTARAYEEGDRPEITQRLTFDSRDRDAASPGERYRMTSADRDSD